MDEKNSGKVFGVFILCVSILSILQFSIKNIVGVDGLFHIKYASLILSEGIMRPFYWWSFASYADTHFLYHVLLIPFTLFGLVEGAKISAIIFGGIAFSLMYWFLKKNKVEFPLFWVLSLFAFGSQALYRFMMPRAFTLALILFILGFYFMLEKKYKYLGILLFLFVWSYTGFLILLFLIVLYFLYEWFVFGNKEWKLLSYSFIGTLLGSVINPFFPENIKTIYVQVVKVLLFPTDILLKSADAQPYRSLGEIFHYFEFVSIVFVVCLFLYFKRKQFTNKVLSFMGIASILTFVLVLKGVRFIEYWVPFTLMFGALTFSEDLKRAYTKVIEIVEGKKIEFTRIKVITILLILLLPFLYIGLDEVKTQVIRGEEIKKFDSTLPCGRWLDKNTEKGSVVFNYWSEFPQVFIHDTNNKFIVGLDPNYMYHKNPELYSKYEKILLIQTNETYDWIKNDFKANYIYLGSFTNKFKPYYDLFKGFEEVFSTPTCTVYKVK